MAIMKFIVITFFAVVITLFVAAICAIPLWLGWNHGIVAAVPALHPIDLFQAFWMNFALGIIGAAFKPSTSGE